MAQLKDLLVNGCSRFIGQVYMNTAVVVTGNDIAEFRTCNALPGKCVVETLNGNLIESTDYHQSGASIVSDTYGFSIGKQENKKPVALTGRVLTYIENLDNVYPGQPVMSAPNGNVALMSREDIKEYPDAIIGYVSEIPKYSVWENVNVNGRVWVKIK